MQKENKNNLRSIAKNLLLTSVIILVIAIFYLKLFIGDSGLTLKIGFLAFLAIFYSLIVYGVSYAVSLKKPTKQAFVNSILVMAFISYISFALYVFGIISIELLTQLCSLYTIIILLIALFAILKHVDTKNRKAVKLARITFVLGLLYLIASVPFIFSENGGLIEELLSYSSMLSMILVYTQIPKILFYGTIIALIFTLIANRSSIKISKDDGANYPELIIALIAVFMILVINVTSSILFFSTLG